MLDIEVNQNNRPLTYIEEDLEYSVLAPNSMVLGRNIKLLADSPEEKELCDNWKKRQRYRHKCMEAAWEIWLHEYLAALRQRVLLKDQFSYCINVVTL